MIEAFSLEWRHLIWILLINLEVRLSSQLLAFAQIEMQLSIEFLAIYGSKVPFPKMCNVFGSETLVSSIGFDSNNNQILAFSGTKVPLPIKVRNIS